MKIQQSIAVLAVLGLAGTGCVTAGKYKDLEKTLDDTTRAMQGQIDQRDQKIAALEKDLADHQEKLDALEKNIVALHKQMDDERTRLNGEREKLQQELAQVVKDRSRLKGSVQEMQQALEDLQRRKREAELRIAEFRNLVDRFKPLIDTGKLKVRMVDGRMVVQLATDVLFSSGSARLSKDGREAIAEVSNVLAGIPNRRFQIEGHTDDVPIKTAQYPSNWELAAARAITVVKTMVDAGMPPARVSAASFGEFKPAQANDTTEGRAANRRIEIVLVPDLSSLPGFDELQRMEAQQAAMP